jgi:hypothetical protein
MPEYGYGRGSAYVHFRFAPKATFRAIALLVPYFVPAFRQRVSLMHLIEISQIRRWLAFLAGINKPSAPSAASVEIKSNACKRHGVRKSFARS